MKAVRLFEFGGPDRLVYGEHPMPEMGAGDALVKVLATSVSRWDVKYRTGEVHEFYGKATGHAGGIAGRKPFPMPMQLGRDVAGDVVAVGADVRGLQAGDRVIGVVHPENPQSSAAKRGLGNLSTGVDLPGHTMFGSYAQFVARPESYWIKASPALDVDQAAACMWACATAHHVVAARLGARANDTLLVTGAAGGMGTATILLAKLAGASVIATTRYPQKAAALKKLGADLVVETRQADALPQIRAFTQGEGVDGAVEYTGATELMRLCIDALRLGGTFCPVGGEMKELPLRVVDMVGKELNVHGVRGSTLKDQRLVAELVGGRPHFNADPRGAAAVAGERSASHAGSGNRSGRAHRAAPVGRLALLLRHAIHDEFGALVHFDVLIGRLLFASMHFLRFLGRHHFLRRARFHRRLRQGRARADNRRRKQHDQTRHDESSCGRLFLLFVLGVNRRRLGHRDRIGRREGFFQSLLEFALEHFLFRFGLFAGRFRLVRHDRYSLLDHSAARPAQAHVKRAFATMRNVGVFEADHK